MNLTQISIEYDVPTSGEMIDSSFTYCCIYHTSLSSHNVNCIAQKSERAILGSMVTSSMKALYFRAKLSSHKRPRRRQFRSLYDRACHMGRMSKWYRSL